MSKVVVSTDVLRWALDRSNRSAGELLPKFPKIEEWLSGFSQPSLKQLENLAHATMTPFGQMFLDSPPEDTLSIPNYRTVSDEDVIDASPDLIESVLAMQGRQDWMRQFAMQEGQHPVPIMGSANPGEDPKVVAQRMREMLGLDQAWASRQLTWSDALRALRGAIEASGILVVVNGVVGNNTHRKLDPSEFRGFVLADNYAPLIFVNGADWKSAQMFTLAHEVAHVMFGSSAAFDLHNMQPAPHDIERQCNWVAAEFLVPESRLRTAWPTAVSDEREPFQLLARQFKVSPIVVARRALDLGLINKDAFLKFYRRYVAEERHKAKQDNEGGGNFYALQGLRIGHRFGSAIIRAVRENKLLYSEAYSLTGIRGKAFDRYAASFV
jgi:Zn-dependent peptidase ImmA (M78 family)